MTALKSVFTTVFFHSVIFIALAHSAFAQAPVLAVSPTTMVFSYTLGSGAAPSQAITVTAASGTGTAVVVSTSITYPSGGPTGWLLIPTPVGLPGLAIPASVNVYLVNTATLSPGSYSATITLNYVGADPSSATTVAVFLTVSAAGSGGTGPNPGETITATPSSLAFYYSPGGGAPAPQVVTVAVGDGAAFTVAAVTNDGNPWLAAVLTSTTTVSVTVNPMILSAGSYAGTITLTAPGASTQVPVTLAVGGVGLSANPAQLSFTVPQNYGFGAPLTIQVTSTPTPSASIMAFGSSDYNWLVVDTPTAQTPAAITVRANDATLAQGTYAGTVTIQTSPTNAVMVPVSLTVGPPATLSLAPASVSFSYTMGNAVPGFQTASVKSLTGAVQSFSITSSTSDGAAWLSATATSPTPGVVNISVNPVILNPGSYSGVVNVLPAGAGSSAQPIAVSLTVMPPPTPVVTAVVSSASYVGGSVAPGEFVTLFGSALGPATLITPPAGTFPTTLGGTMVTFGGLPAPILYASNTQTTVQVPYGIAIGQTVLSVQHSGVSSTLLPITSVPAFPGFFTANFSGKGQIAALNQDYSLNSPSNPAARGSVIILYGTGEGVTTPTSIEGMITPTVAPFPKTQLPISVTFQGLPAVLQYYGETPGAVSGLLQINAVVPAAAPTGSAVSVLISINGQYSPGGTTVAIK